MNHFRTPHFSPTETAPSSGGYWPHPLCFLTPFVRLSPASRPEHSSATTGSSTPPVRAPVSFALCKPRSPKFSLGDGEDSTTISGTRSPERTQWGTRRRCCGALCAPSALTTLGARQSTSAAYAAVLPAPSVASEARTRPSPYRDLGGTAAGELYSSFPTPSLGSLSCSPPSHHPLLHILHHPLLCFLCDVQMHRSRQMLQLRVAHGAARASTWDAHVICCGIQILNPVLCPSPCSTGFADTPRGAFSVSGCRQVWQPRLPFGHPFILLDAARRVPIRDP